jgi:hypothetical protein
MAPQIRIRKGQVMTRKLMHNPGLAPVGLTLALLLAVSPLLAQSGPVLQGGVQQTRNSPSDQQVQTTVLDMYHQLSIMWGNQSASQDAQRQFEADLKQFNGYVSARSALAERLAPCVSKYQQAYPHVVQQSRYYTQNNSSAFNSEQAIANPLIKAGASCASAATADEFATNTGKTYNTYQPAPPFPSAPAPVYQAPSGAWLPRCETPKSTNCYLWRLNANGLYDHLYQGSPSTVPDPNPSSSSCSTCMTVGSGYRPAPGTVPQLAWTAGFTKGTSECLKQGATNPVSLCLMSAAILSARFKSAAGMAGVVLSGRVLALQAVMNDAQRDLSSSADPYQTGMFYGQRFCTWLTAGAALVAPAPTTQPVDPVLESCPRNVKPGESDYPVLEEGVPADPSTANVWLKKINPLGCNANCPFTPANVDNALAGKGVMPAPPLKGMSSTGEMMPTEYAKEMLQDLYGRTFGQYQPAQQVAGIIQRGGWGARGILHASRPNGPGHFLNIVNYKGTVMLLDGQLGRIVNWSELASNGFNEFSLMRTN